MTKKISKTLTQAKTFFFTAETKLEFLLNVLIIVLAASVLVLGVMISVRYQVWLRTSLFIDSFMSNSQKEEITTMPSEEFAQDTTDKNELLNLTSEDMASRYQEIQAAAVETSQVVIDSCQADPAIAIVTLGQTLAITNKSDFPVSLILGEETIELSANATKEVVPLFKHGVGTYGYFCDGQGGVQSPTQNTGIFIVKE